MLRPPRIKSREREREREERLSSCKSSDCSLLSSSQKLKEKQKDDGWKKDEVINQRETVEEVE